MKQNLLLLHGAIGSSGQFEKIKGFLEDTYLLHAIDLPGHGGSEMPKSFTMELFCKHVEDYIRLHSLQGAPVFGYSMGGFIALLLNNSSPGITGKIITLGTKFEWSEAIAGKEVAMLQPSVIEEKLPAFAASLQQAHHPNNWKEVLEKTVTLLGVLGRDNPLSREKLEKISNECLIMLGDRDRMVSLDETRAAYNAIPKAMLCVLPGTPHPLEQADPELLAFQIKRFLK